MTEYPPGRRDFLKTMTALGAAALPLAPAGPNTKATYNPAAKFEIKVSEVDFRRTRAGRTLMARIYQPDGPGPFPAVLDLHDVSALGGDQLADPDQLTGPVGQPGAHREVAPLDGHPVPDGDGIRCNEALLAELTAHAETLAGIDYDRADQDIKRELPPVPGQDRAPG